MKPTYDPGIDVTLDVDRWCGLALMVDKADHDLAEYILDEIANKNGDHTIYGMTPTELAPMRVELFFTLMQIEKGLEEYKTQQHCTDVNTKGYVRSAQEECQEQ